MVVAEDFSPRRKHKASAQEQQDSEQEAYRETEQQAKDGFWQAHGITRSVLSLSRRQKINT
jgi:hypothetical protein